MRVDMDLAWVVWALTVPLAAAFLAAYPLWRLRLTDEMGSVVGAGVVLVFAVAFVAREFGDVQAAASRCAALGVGCRFSPAPFMRYAIFSAIGMGQVFVLFIVGLFIEEHFRARDCRKT